MVSIIEPEKGWVPGSSIWHPLIYVCTLNFSPGFRVGVSLTLTPSFYFVVLHFFTDYYFLLSLLYFLSAMPPPKLKLQHIYSLCIFSIQHYFDHKQFSKNHICFVTGVKVYKVLIQTRHRLTPNQDLLSWILCFSCKNIILNCQDTNFLAGNRLFLVWNS